MHELSVAVEICRIVQDRLGDDLPTLATVAVDVGDDCGLEPENLGFCLDTLLAQPPFPGATAILQRQPGDVLRVSYLEVDDGNPDD
ncbi:MAG TPA: hydrogenase/urease maturation nickel metallochaperone HypA [Gemmatimonadaceae bacterium]|nr:hydrogenase/urease maturation nickel metallochaperone HypA [Gemmatimonadaceae bacterium]